MSHMSPACGNLNRHGAGVHHKQEVSKANLGQTSQSSSRQLRFSNSDGFPTHEMYKRSRAREPDT